MSFDIINILNTFPSTLFILLKFNTHYSVGPMTPSFNSFMFVNTAVGNIIIHQPNTIQHCTLIITSLFNDDNYVHCVSKGIVFLPVRYLIEQLITGLSLFNNLTLVYLTSIHIHTTFIANG